MSNEVLLKLTLEVAVPLWIDKLQKQLWSEVMVRKDEAAQTVAEKGDIILYKSKKPGQTAKAFNALAEGVAILAFAPGGVKVFGLHFEAKHPEAS